jgi:hypothetical protein
MAEFFEKVMTAPTAADHVSKTLARLQELPSGIKLASNAGQSMKSGARSWTFVLTREAEENWDALGKQRMVVAVLVYHLQAKDAPYVERILVAAPGSKGALTLEWFDSNWNLLYKGRGALVDGELDFEMPITRPGVKEKGIMAGRVSRKGRITLRESQLPRPINKRKPKFEATDS